MTDFDIFQSTDRPDRIFVELDHRFEVAIIRTASGIELRIYPRTEGLLWDAPFAAFTINEQEIIALETEMES